MSTEPDEDVSGSVADQIKGWFVGRLPAMVHRAGRDHRRPRRDHDHRHAARARVATDAESAAAEGRIKRFREDTRARRIEIAREAERKFGRKVAWGARCGDLGEMFTTLSVPVMTRLRQSERRVLDTLVDAGVARTAVDALAWCVRLTGEHADAWLAELRDALRRVEEVTVPGPGQRDRQPNRTSHRPPVKRHVTSPDRIPWLDSPHRRSSPDSRD